MNEALGMFHFLRPAWLLLAPISFCLWWLWRRRTDPLRGWRQQMDAELLAALTVGQRSTRGGSGAWLLAGWLFAVLSIAGPTWRLAPSPFAADGTPLMILLKADASMELPDPEPSRLDRARLKITDLVRVRPGQPLGLVCYAGSAHLVLPPTRDNDVVRTMAAEVSPEIMPEPGDRLDLALEEAQRVLSGDAAGGSVLVIADSIDTDLDALERAQRSGPRMVQILAVNTPGSSEDSALRAAAERIGARVQSMSVDDADVTALARRAERAPRIQPGEGGARWQEPGYYLVLLVALCFLLERRRGSASRGAAR